MSLLGVRLRIWNNYAEILADRPVPLGSDHPIRLRGTVPATSALCNPIPLLTLP